MPKNEATSDGRAIVVCEDGDGEGWTDGDESCRVGGDTFLRVVTLDGPSFDLAQVIEPLDLMKTFPDDFERIALRSRFPVRVRSLEPVSSLARPSVPMGSGSS